MSSSVRSQPDFAGATSLTIETTSHSKMKRHLSIYAVLAIVVVGTLLKFSSVSAQEKPAPAPPKPAPKPQPGVVVTVTSSQESLWPPNGKPVGVTFTVVVENGIKTPVNGITWSLTDEYGEINQSGEILVKGTKEGKGASGLTGSVTIDLIASRNGDDQDGRTYTFTAVAGGDLGKKGGTTLGTGEAVVVVPHDKGHGNGNGD